MAGVPILRYQCTACGKLVDGPDGCAGQRCPNCDEGWLTIPWGTPAEAYITHERAEGMR